MRQRCKNCGSEDKFDFRVPDSVWRSIVPPRLQERVVCLPCFDTMAATLGIPYVKSIKKLYFAGDGGSMTLERVEERDGG